MMGPGDERALARAGEVLVGRVEDVLDRLVRLRRRQPAPRRPLRRPRRPAHRRPPRPRARRLRALDPRRLPPAPRPRLARRPGGDRAAPHRGGEEPHVRRRLDARGAAAVHDRVRVTDHRGGPALPGGGRGRPGDGRRDAPGVVQGRDAPGRPLGPPVRARGLVSVAGERHPGLDAELVAALDRLGEALAAAARRAAEREGLSPVRPAAPAPGGGASAGPPGGGAGARGGAHRSDAVSAAGPSRPSGRSARSAGRSASAPWARRWRRSTRWSAPASSPARGCARRAATCAPARRARPAPWACALLGRPLTAGDLRVDCAEHEAA